MGLSLATWREKQLHLEEGEVQGYIVGFSKLVVCWADVGPTQTRNVKIIVIGLYPLLPSRRLALCLPLLR